MFRRRSFIKGSVWMLFLACVLLISACMPVNRPDLSIPVQLTVESALGTIQPVDDATPVVMVPINFSPRVDFPQAWFSIMPVKDYMPYVPELESHIEENRLTLHNADKSLFYAFSYSETSGVQDHEGCLNPVLNKMKDDWVDFSSDPIQPAAYPQNSLGLSFKGVLQERASQGSLIASYQNHLCYVFMAVYAEEMSKGGHSNENLGAALFNAMLQSIKIDTMPPKPTCQISEDPEYGKNVEKPIQIGNTNIRDGKTREELYLQTLRGPEGQELSFERQQPILNQQGGVVDVYSVSYAGLSEPVLIYFDIYSYAQPLAAMGFTCISPFPLEQP